MHNVLDACISQKTWEFQGPTPSHFPKLWICTHPNHYAQGCINHRCIGCFTHTSPLVTITGCIPGSSRAHTVGGWRSKWESNSPSSGRSGELRNLTTLLHPSYSLPPPLLFSPPTQPPSFSPTDSPPSHPTPPHPEFIRNQQQAVRCIKGHSGV